MILAVPASRSMPSGAPPLCEGLATRIFCLSFSSRRYFRLGWNSSKKLTRTRCSLGRGRLCNGVGTVGAQSEDFQIVLHVAESMSLSDLAGPALHCRSFDFDGTAAAPAYQVVMVTGRAPAVGGFTIVGPDGVQLVGACHQLQGSVNGGESDSRTGMTQVIVNLTGRAELVGPPEDLLNCGTLAGPTLRSGHQPLLPPPSQVHRQGSDAFRTDQCSDVVVADAVVQSRSSSMAVGLSSDVFARPQSADTMQEGQPHSQEQDLTRSSAACSHSSARR